MKIHALRKLGFKGRRFLTKTLLVMKLTAILLLLCFLQVNAKKTIAQDKISLSVKNAPLEKVFEQIEKQTGYIVWCEKKLLDQTTNVTLQVVNATIEQAMTLCLNGQPLQFAIVEKTIVVSPKGKHADLNNAQKIDIRGQVTDDKQRPLDRATIEIKGGKKGTFTDINGMFELKQVDANATLAISYNGFITKEINVDAQTFLTILLNQSNNPLDAVQVIAYGTTTARLSTGNVTTVKAAEIENQPVTNPLLALEGRVPGMYISQSTGFAGSGVTVRIQGQNSILNGNDPLYVIDGVPYTSQLLPTLSNVQGGSGGIVGGLLTGGNGNPLSYFNPSDIESINILKDADATAIYGSRAANGAVIITTKKGRTGQTRVNFNVQNGWGKVTKKLDLLNTRQYLEMRHEAIANDQSTVQPTDYDINGTWDTTRNTDWQKELLGGTAKYFTANGSVSGGNANTQYLISGNYHRETTVFPGDLFDQKGGLHFTLNSASTDQRFHIQLSANYLADNNHITSNDLTSLAVTLAPDGPKLYNSDGTLNWAENAAGSTTWPYPGNPLAYLYQSYSIDAKNLVGNSTLAYQLLPDLEVKCNLGYTDLQTHELILNPLTAVAPENRPSSQRVAIYGNNGINSWIAEPQLSYKKSMGKARFQALVGTTFMDNKGNGEQIYGYGYSSDAQMKDIRSASSLVVGSTTQSEYKYSAFFGRVNMDWADRYIVNVTARRDGSSRFGSQNQFHSFGALGLSWVFSNEKWLARWSRFLTYGKLRASYGTTGNDQIGDYRFLNLYAPPTNVFTPYQGATGLLPTGLPNAHLQWEETKKLDIGVNLGFLDNRIFLNADYFQNQSSNQLLNYNISIVSGFNNVLQNFPAKVGNSGFEISVNTVNVKTSKFSWSTAVNVTIPKNKLISFPGLANSSYAYLLSIGQPVSIHKVFHLSGVNDTTGIYQFSDTKGNLTYNPSLGKDNTVIINTAPTLYGGLSNNFRFKNFGLDILFQFVKQRGLNYAFGNLPGYNSINQPSWVMDRWQKQGDIKSHQRFSSTYSTGYSQFSYASNQSDAAYTDASFIRLKDLSFFYEFGNLKKRMGLNNCRVYLQAQNLLTFTSYKGTDPETLSSTTMPPLRVWVFGAQIGL